MQYLLRLGRFACEARFLVLPTLTASVDVVLGHTFLKRYAEIQFQRRELHPRVGAWGWGDWGWVGTGLG